MRSAWSSQQIKSLLNAGTPQEFLRVAILEKKSEGKSVSYASIARSAGFASRSFPRDVILGTKQLKPSSATAIAKAFKLTSELSDYFLSLVERESSFNKSKYGEIERLDKKIANQRRRILVKIETKHIDGNDVFSVANTPTVYASLGSLENGSSLKEIEARCGLDAREIRLVIEHLVKLGLACEREERFYAIANHVGFEHLQKDGSFQKVYVQRLKAAIKKAESDFNSRQDLFLESTFSVSKENLPTFKKELRDLMLKFIENREDSEGNGIASFSCALILL